MSDIKIKGVVYLQLRDRFGNLIDEVYVENAIMQKGLSLVTDTLLNKTEFINQIAVGSSNAFVHSAQEHLFNELSKKDIASNNIIRYNYEKDCLEFITTFYAEDFSGDIYEAGLFKDNIMFSRIVFNKLSKSFEQSLTIIWQLVFIA